MDAIGKMIAEAEENTKANALKAGDVAIVTRHENTKRTVEALIERFHDDSKEEEFLLLLTGLEQQDAYDAIMLLVSEVAMRRYEAEKREALGHGLE